MSETLDMVMTSANSTADAASPVNSRGALVAACALTWGVIVVGYAQDAWMSILSLLLADGVLVVLWVLAAACLGDLLVRPARWTASKPLAFATAAGIGLGAFSLAALGLGLVGLLNRPTAIALPVLSFILWFIRVDRTRFTRDDDLSSHLRAWLRKPAGWHWLFIATMPALAVATVAASVLPGFMWKPDDPHPYDVVSYHLQVPREWYDLGRIVPLPHNVFSYFPFNVEMQYLLGMHLHGGAWAGMYFSQFMSLAYAVLMVIAVYGVARMFASRAGATLAAAAAASLPWIAMLGSVGYVETALLLYVALAVGWTIVAVGSLADESRNRLWMAALITGVTAGLACGVKLTAGPMLLAPVPLAVVLAALAFRKPVGRAFGSAVMMGVVAMVILSPWLFRNLAWSGNPFFPNAISVFGAGDFSPGQVERYAAAHAAVPNGQGPITAIAHQVVVQWQYGYALVPLAIVGLALAGRARAQVACVIGIVLIVQLAFWIGFTHRIGRFFVPAIPLMAIAVALVERQRAARWIAAITIALAALLGWLGAFESGGGMHTRLARFAEIGRQGVFAMEDVSFLQPMELQRIYDAGGVVHFVGDAQTFLHKARSSQVPYRTIFNVRADADDPITAWTGRPLSELPEGEWVLIDPAEIQRLSSTYRHVPSIPPTYPGPRDRPYMLNRHGHMIVPER
ncbi:MAG TPA: hypothetical protein VGN72_12640 [Tepidisphaeraceae bacterium]|jgi:hypothetical protein|nr:hypothetical protein [Tepidisphaeraceae bacterium]